MQTGYQAAQIRLHERAARATSARSGPAQRAQVEAFRVRLAHLPGHEGGERVAQERLVTAYTRFENIDYLASVAEERAAPPLPPVPLIVLARGQTPPQEAFLPDWPVEQTEPRHRAMMADLAGRSPRGTLRIADRSGHYIHRDEPELVLAAIRQVVDIARSQGS